MIWWAIKISFFFGLLALAVLICVFIGRPIVLAWQVMTTGVFPPVVPATGIDFLVGASVVLAIGFICRKRTFTIRLGRMFAIRVRPGTGYRCEWNTPYVSGHSEATWDGRKFD